MLLPILVMPCADLSLNPSPVDYILFITSEVTVTPNLNEIRDHKWVDKKELQDMFDAPGLPSLWP